MGGVLRPGRHLQRPGGSGLQARRVCSDRCSKPAHSSARAFPSCPPDRTFPGLLPEDLPKAASRQASAMKSYLPSLGKDLRIHNCGFGTDIIGA